MANYQSNYTGEQIDEAVGKVLGGMCLPVVDFTGRNSGEITDEATIQLLDEFVDSGTPFILKYNLHDNYVSAFTNNYRGTNGYVHFETAYWSPAATITREQNSTAWIFNINTGA